MTADDIETGGLVEYRREMGGLVHSGIGEVLKKIYRSVGGGGWVIVVFDTLTKRIHKLRPAHILRLDKPK